jgi:hypothetical protein
LQAGGWRRKEQPQSPAISSPPRRLACPPSPRLPTAAASPVPTNFPPSRASPPYATSTRHGEDELTCTDAVELTSTPFNSSPAAAKSTDPGAVVVVARVQPAGTHRRYRRGGLVGCRRCRWLLLGGQREKLALAEGRRWVTSAANCVSTQGKEQGRPNR